VGQGPAAEFVTYCQLYAQLPDIDAILKSPTTAPVPTKEASVMFALVGALVERCRKNKSLVPNFVKYGTRLPDEFGMLALRDALTLDGTVAAHPDVQNWIKQARAKGMFIGA
jgi:hypothetical protein